MIESTIKLITQTIVPDAIGNQTVQETSKEVFCSVYPIAQNEFFSARTLGISPRLKFCVSFVDYEGEELAEFEGQRYVIYRVYDNTNDIVELYAERKLGRNTDDKQVHHQG